MTADERETEDLVRLGELLPAPIRNRYGSPSLAMDDGAWVLTLAQYGQADTERAHKPEDWSSVAVSDNFARAWIAEFGGAA